MDGSLCRENITRDTPLPSSGDAVMPREGIIEYFGSSQTTELPTFRKLSNALKAMVIGEAMKASDMRRGKRLHVLDLGCGKGGDLWKWARYRIGRYEGVDGNAGCIEGARTRHSTVLAQGQSSLLASFFQADLSGGLPQLEDHTFDIASSQFSLQFSFETSEIAHKLIHDVHRVLKHRGILCGILPDGDRVYSLLASSNRMSVCFGHFFLSRYPYTFPLTCERGISLEKGIPYKFSLTDSGCTEYIVPPAQLHKILEQAGFVPVIGADYSVPAHRFWTENGDKHQAKVLLGDDLCSAVDWRSLGLFRVVLARCIKEDSAPQQQPKNSKRPKRGVPPPPHTDAASAS